MPKEINVTEYLAPHIIGNKLIRQIVTIQLFSNPSAGEKLHILIYGEVSSGKTDIGYDAHRISVKGAYCSKKTTPTGLVESAIASDGGLLVIDEFDKVNKQVREQLLDAMQLGKIFIARHDYIEEVPARMNVLALSNPRGDRVNPSTPVSTMLPFGRSVLSRFHIILPSQPVSPDHYPALARHFHLKSEVSEAEVLKLKELMEETMREVPAVSISEDLSGGIGTFVRGLVTTGKNRDLISPRTLEGAINMAKAVARMRRASIVSEEDVLIVKKVFKAAYG